MLCIQKEGGRMVVHDFISYYYICSSGMKDLFKMDGWIFQIFLLICHICMFV